MLPLALAGCVGQPQIAPPSCAGGGKCDGTQPIPSCSVQQVGALDVYAAGTVDYYLPDRWVVTNVSIATPIAPDIFPSEPFDRSPYFDTCRLTLGLRPDADPAAVAAARAQLGDIALQVAPTTAAGRPVEVTFATVEGLPPLETSRATFRATDGGLEMMVPVPAGSCSAFATLLVHQRAIVSITSQRTMACEGGTVPVTVTSPGAQLTYETPGVDDDSTIYDVLNDILAAEQAGPALANVAQDELPAPQCADAPSVLADLAQPFDDEIHATLDPTIPFDDETVTLDQVHAAGQAAQDAALQLAEQVMQRCGAPGDEASVRAYLSRTDLGPSGYTGDDDLVAQTYRATGELATFDPATAHTLWRFQL